MAREVHQCQCAVCAAGEDGVTQAAHRQINVLLSQLNEVQRRWYGGSLSQQAGGPSDRELMRITGLISLPFYFTTKPGIGVQLTEYKGNTAFNTQAPIRIDSQLTQAFYEINGQRHALTVIQDGTTIRFEALVNEVSKDDLVKLAGQLQLIGK